MTKFNKKTRITIGIGLGILFLAVIALSVYQWKQKKFEALDEVEVTDSTEVEEIVYKYGIPTDRYNVKYGIVKPGQTLSVILSEHGLSKKEIHELSQNAEGTFDVRKIKDGQAYAVFTTQDSLATPRYFVYEEDPKSYIVFDLKESHNVSRGKNPVEWRQKEVKGQVESSLWVAMQNNNTSPQLAIVLSHIFGWSIDFFGLQKGDWFKVMYDQATYRGEVLYIDKVHYCVFNHGGKDNYAYWYDQGDGSSNRYWNENGESLKKAFLKAPLKFTRISSGFTYARKHPITRVVRPHTGIDYAAPSGTPVMSIGDGVVTQRSYQGGGGNTVKIKHNSVYTSAYLHLSKYGPGIKVGSRVKQGQIIGYVGSTGMSTGPHLDFRIWKNGSPINPLKMESPSIEPVKKENMPAFKAYISRYENCQDSLKAVSLCNDYIELLF